MKSKEKIRLDELLVQKKSVATRAKARALILAGEVQVNNQPVDKAGTLVFVDAEIKIAQPLKYVGRGGLKLEKALKEFCIDVSGCVCVDVGASTGGFSDCLLQNGAKKIYAIDVGYGQMHWKLQSDPRVVRWDRENFRHFDVSRISEVVNVAVVDVSFISSTLIIPKIAELFHSQQKKQSEQKRPVLVVLVKPQFEAGPENVGKGGIVKDAAVHMSVLEKVQKTLDISGFVDIKITNSPISGADGNKEFLISGTWNNEEKKKRS